MGEKQKKSRYWTGVLYPESTPDWKENISSALEVPYCYCVHDKDIVEGTGEVVEHRKTHVHVIFVFSNTTTYNHALEVFQRLSPTTQAIQDVVDISSIYKYLIHDNDDCRKKNKYQYAKEERICGNDFDIGSYVQLDKAEKQEIKKMLFQVIKDNDITEYFEMVDYVNENCNASEIEVFDSCVAQFHYYINSYRNRKYQPKNEQQ